jgi:hypothetical protein
MDQNQSEAKTHTGSCICGAVRFSAELTLEGMRCNCTSCMKLHPTGEIIKPEALTVLSGQEHLSSYKSPVSAAERFFCKRCGVYCFAKNNIAELGGDIISVNLNTIDGLDINQLTLIHWDGRHDNWEAGPRPTPWPVAAQ